MDVNNPDIGMGKVLEPYSKFPILAGSITPRFPITQGKSPSVVKELVWYKRQHGTKIGTLGQKHALKKSFLVYI